MSMAPEINQAAAVLRAGGLVAFPTETVYGLGADASNAAAVQAIFSAKERPFNHPLIVHIAAMNALPNWVQEVSPAAERLAQAFWPGPLTMIFKKQAHVLDILTGGQNTIGMRLPSHPIARALLTAFGGGVAAPSANKFTHVSPTTASGVLEELGGRVDMILDGGECEVGLESTIIDLSGAQPVILRPGMITLEQISAVLGMNVTMTQPELSKTLAPGMHYLHYAPTTKTSLCTSQEIAMHLQQLPAADLPAVVLMHSEREIPTHAQITRVQMPKTAVGYAHDLYRILRELDQQQFKCIMIEELPDAPEWVAIRDRLSKASRR